MEIKASYRCKMCGTRFYMETALNPRSDIYAVLGRHVGGAPLMSEEIPDTIIHKCDTDKVGIAKLIGIRKFD